MISGSAEPGGEEEEDENAQRRNRSGALNGRRPNANKEEDDLCKAIEESKRSIAQDQATAEQRDLEEAIRLSVARLSIIPIRRLVDDQSQAQVVPFCEPRAQC
jgi:hypothetical protein